MYQGEQISYSKIFNSRKFNPIIQNIKQRLRRNYKISHFFSSSFPSNFSANKQTQMQGNKKLTQSIKSSSSYLWRRLQELPSLSKSQKQITKPTEPRGRYQSNQNRQSPSNPSRPQQHNKPNFHFRRRPRWEQTSKTSKPLISSKTEPFFNWVFHKFRHCCTEIVHENENPIK